MYEIVFHGMYGIIQQWLTHTGDVKNSGSFSVPRGWNPWMSHGLDVSPMLIWHQGHDIFLEGCWSSVSVGNLKNLILIPAKESSAATTGEMDLSDSECQMGKNIPRKACPLPGSVPDVWFPHVHQSSQNSSHRYAHEPTQGRKSLTESFPR